ncbi:MAG TPA: hypothetical protein PKA64_17395, partial [Myxococcota bacterium]|nr:hypothetical protein [Myxococcota bacterium]
MIAGRYQLDQRLHVGEDRVVWRGVDLATDDRVVIKLFTQADPLMWRQEVTALRLANLPGVVRLLDEGVEREVAFLVMEEVAGLPFPGRGHPSPDLLVVIDALLQAVAGLHVRGISHRDLKPSNVLVDQAGRVTLLDLADAGGSDLPLRARPLGFTPRFAAPEQRVGPYDGARADVWTLALLVVFALTRELPGAGEPPARWARHKLAQQTDRVDAARAALLIRALSPNPEDRPADALAMGHAWGGRQAPLLDLPDLAAISTTAALADLFVQDHRMISSGRDAATALHHRTGGHRDAVHEELAAWLRGGLVSWREGRLHITQDRAAALLAGERVRLELHDPPGLSADERRTLACVRALFPHATAAGVHRLGGKERALRALQRAGRVWPIDDGTLGAEIAWRDGSEAVDRAQAIGVLPPGTPRALSLSGGPGPVDEGHLHALCAWAEWTISQGHASRVIAVLAPHLRGLSDQGEERPLTELAQQIALAGVCTGAAEGIEAALRLLEAVGHESRTVTDLVTLLRVWRAILRREASRVASARLLPPFSHPSLEIWRQGSRFWDACLGEGLEATREELERWAAADDDRLGAWLTWEANRHFERQAFAEAITCLTRALPLRRRVDQQVATRLNLARIHQQLGQFEAASVEAERVVDQARAARLARHGVSAAYVLRDTARRRGAPLEPDPGWIEEAERVHAGVAAALAAVDAAVWLDRGDPRAADVAAAGLKLARRAGARPEALLLGS